MIRVISSDEKLNNKLQQAHKGMLSRLLASALLLSTIFICTNLHADKKPSSSFSPTSGLNSGKGFGKAPNIEREFEDNYFLERESEGDYSPRSKKTTEIFSWIDENGNAAFGDKPEKKHNAKALDIKPIPTLGFPKNRPSVASVSSEVQSTSPQQAYSQVLITSPANDSTLRDNEGNVNVAVTLSPSLQSGHKVQVYLDGNPYGSAQELLSISMTDVDRGSHSISVEVQDDKGSKLISSPASTFHMHRYLAR